jgi:hypothetical protein
VLAEFRPQRLKPQSKQMQLPHVEALRHPKSHAISAFTAIFVAVLRSAFPLRETRQAASLQKIKCRLHAKKRPLARPLPGS